jgi:Ankyrin repeats (3 copies)
MPGPTVRHSLAAIATLGLALAVWLAWPGTNTLVGQAARGDVAGARWSLRLGVDPDIPMRWGWSRENEGQTPLTVAAQFGRIEIVRLLLADGADPDLRDFGGQGDTALSTAARQEYPCKSGLPASWSTIRITRCISTRPCSAS